jgi:hypothetical protein
LFELFLAGEDEAAAELPPARGATAQVAYATPANVA